MSNDKVKMITVRALKPLVGAYPILGTDVPSDHISKVLDHNDRGELVEKRIAYKKFRMAMQVERAATPDDLADNQMSMARGEPSRVSLDGSRIITPADVMELPSSYVEANELVERGLVEIIADPKPAKKLAA